MNRVALNILKAVEKRERSHLPRPFGMAKPRHKDHLDQYPLALLLEGGYLGVTIHHTPPIGAEQMREFSWATTLHMLTLPKESDGVVRYLEIESRKSMTR
jgi:hypothetical protein